MTLEEIREKKRTAEATILAVLRGFEEDTGCVPSDLHVESSAIVNISPRIRSVKIEVSI